MPFDFLQKSLLGKRKIEEILKQAQEIFEVYIWSPTNLSSGQYGGDYIKLSDAKTTGTAGGSSSTTTTHTRTLNTEDFDTGSICTLSSNQFTLTSGTYRIIASAPAYRADRHKAFLYNVSDSANELIGTSEFADNTNAVGNRAFVIGQFTITSSKTFELRHYVATAQASNGLGVETNDGTSEIYSIVELWKVI